MFITFSFFLYYMRHEVIKRVNHFEQGSFVTVLHQLQIFSCAIRHYLGFILIVIYCDKIVFTKVVGAILEERDNVARLGNKNMVR